RRVLFRSVLVAMMPRVSPAIAPRNKYISILNIRFILKFLLFENKDLLYRFVENFRQAFSNQQRRDVILTLNQADRLPGNFRKFCELGLVETVSCAVFS